MPERTEQQPTELDMLRKANGELTEKSRTRKAKIAELEACNAELTKTLASAGAALHEATVGAPLRKLAATVSAVPEIWQAEFAKHYNLEMRDGKLTVLTVAGEVVLDRKGPIQFEPSAIAKLVTTGDSDEANTFRHITAGSLASGGNAISQDRDSSFPTPQPRQKEQPRSKTQFGLR